jgi:succinyl-diaminopimelate desuccinylase
VVYSLYGGEAMKDLKIVQKNKSRIIDNLKALLRFPSLYDEASITPDTPFGKPIDDALEWMLSKGETDGFLVKNVDHFAGHIEFGEGQEVLGLLGHLDVVPTGEINKWSQDPFKPLVTKEKIIARGAIDDKGPTIAAYMAMLLLKEEGFIPNKVVRLILGTDEETKMRGIKYYLEKEKTPEIGFAPDANFPLIYAEKGLFTYFVKGKVKPTGLLSFNAGERFNVVPDYATCTLEDDHVDAFNQYLAYHNFDGGVDATSGKLVYYVRGKNAHAMQPSHGVNAGFLLAGFLDTIMDNDFIKHIINFYAYDHLGEKLNVQFYDEEMKEFTMNLGIFQYDQGTFTLGMNGRYPKGWDANENLKAIQTLTETSGFTFELDEHKPLHYVSKDSELVKKLMTSYQAYTSDFDHEPMSIGGGTYARMLPNAVAFGTVFPGHEETAHQVDEYILIDDLLLSTAIYMDAIRRLTS